MAGKLLGKLSTDVTTDPRIKNKTKQRMGREGGRMGRLVQTQHDDVTYKVIGAAMDVHNRLGPGLKEVHYQKAMVDALSGLKMDFEEQKQIGVYFEKTLAGLLFLDLFVERAIVVELKALSHRITKNELAQVVTYLKASGSELGLLINFGRKYLEYMRVFPPAIIREFDQNDWRFAVKLKRPEFKRSKLDKAQHITCALH